jgi:hypothetical protein
VNSVRKATHFITNNRVGEVAFVDQYGGSFCERDRWPNIGHLVAREPSANVEPHLVPKKIGHLLHVVSASGTEQYEG